MKENMLELLVCPHCHANLELKDSSIASGEIRSGVLRCAACDRSYPIVDFIARFVATDSYVDTFSFEWNKFHDVQMDILNRTDISEKTFSSKTGWFPEDLRGKRILDVGVGAGRFADVVSRWGGEAIGVDLSFAVNAADKNIGRRHNVHILQADLFRLPFREGTFDAIYSIGVLHHTPDTEKAFQAIVPYLKNGGEIAIFLYAYGPYHAWSDRWRKMTTRLPTRLTYCLSSIAVPLYYIHKVPFLGKVTQLLLPTSMWPDWRWRWLDTLDWYTPRYQWKHSWPEVYRWFQEAGLRDMDLFQESRDSSLGLICMRGRKP